MNNKTRGTAILVCGILGTLAAVLLIVLNLVFKYNFGGRNNIITSVIFLVLGIGFCFLGARTRKQQDK